MPVSTVEIFFLFFFVFLLGVVLYLLYKTYSYGNSLKARPLARGLNGSAGDTITLTCPAGQVIEINQATYVCSGAETNGTASDTCDPILTQGPTVTPANYGTFNPATTSNVAATLAAQCNGKQTTTITVPSASTLPTICNGQPCGGGNNIQLIGTYYCKAPSS